MFKDLKENSWFIGDYLRRNYFDNLTGETVLLNGNFGCFKTNRNKVIKINKMSDCPLFREIHFYLNVCKDKQGEYS
jgi:hypothetical protein